MSRLTILALLFVFSAHAQDGKEGSQKAAPRFHSDPPVYSDTRFPHNCDEFLKRFRKKAVDVLLASCNDGEFASETKKEIVATCSVEEGTNYDVNPMIRYEESNGKFRPPTVRRFFALSKSDEAFFSKCRAVTSKLDNERATADAPTAPTGQPLKTPRAN